MENMIDEMTQHNKQSLRERIEKYLRFHSNNEVGKVVISATHSDAREIIQALAQRLEKAEIIKDFIELLEVKDSTVYMQLNCHNPTVVALVKKGKQTLNEISLDQITAVLNEGKK